MTSRIQKLASHYGVTLSSRSVSGDYLWDGKTLGLSYQEWDDEWNDQGENWRSPRFLPELLTIPGFDVLHDIAHYVVAPVWARDLPEFGLWVTGEFGANGGYHLKRIGAESMDGLFNLDEQNRQEQLAYLMGIYFCMLCDEPVPEDKRFWIPEYATGAPREYAFRVASDLIGASQDDLQRALMWAGPVPVYTKAEQAA